MTVSAPDGTVYELPLGTKNAASHSTVGTPGAGPAPCELESDALPAASVDALLEDVNSAASGQPAETFPVTAFTRGSDPPSAAGTTVEMDLWLDFADFSLAMVINESQLEELESTAAMYDREMEILQRELRTLQQEADQH